MIQKLTRNFFSAFFQFFHRMKKWRWGFFCHLIKRHLAEIASPSSPSSSSPLSTSLSHLLRFRETASTLQNDLMTWVKEKWTNRGERRKIEGSQKTWRFFSWLWTNIAVTPWHQVRRPERFPGLSSWQLAPFCSAWRFPAASRSRTSHVRSPALPPWRQY